MTLKEGELYDKYSKLRDKLLSILNIKQLLFLNEMEDAQDELNKELHKEIPNKEKKSKNMITFTFKMMLILIIIITIIGGIYLIYYNYKIIYHCKETEIQCFRSEGYGGIVGGITSVRTECNNNWDYKEKICIKI